MIKVLVRYCAVISRRVSGSSCGLRTESALVCRSRRRFGEVCLARRAFPIDSARAEGASGAFCREQDLTEAEAHVSPGTLTLYRNTCSLLLYCSAWKTSKHISRTYKATGLATPEEPQLNAAQLEAVTTTEGLRSRDRGCGYGQTRALTHRFAYLVNDLGILPGNILCVTFSNKAANEMRQRIRRVTGDNDTGYICIVP